MKRMIFGIFFGILGIISITLGISYSFYNYAHEGSNDNIITTDKIIFLYNSLPDIENGISIQNATPISDEQGKVLSGIQEYFDFEIIYNGNSLYNIPYEITVRKTKDSTMDDQFLKVYLTELNNNLEETRLLEPFIQLAQTEQIKEEQYIEKIIYRDEIQKNQSNYDKKFRLRIWNSTDGLNETTVPSSDSTFSLTVHVYASGVAVISEEPN